MNAEIVSKLAPSVIMGGKIGKPSAPKALFTVMGIATGTVIGESTFGPWEALTGNFEAVNVETGQVFRSSKLFLPATVNGMIAGQFHGKKEDENLAVRFALKIGIKPSDKPVGYEYTVAPIVEAAEDPGMAELRQAVADDAHRLEAPKHKK